MVVRRVVTIAALLGLIGLLSLAVPLEPSFEGPSATLSFPTSPLTFRYPATWRVYRNYGYGHIATLAYLSTSPLHNPCRTDPRKHVTSCDGANLIRRIPPDGVLASWAILPPDATQDSLSATIGGAPALLSVQRPAPSRGGLWGCEETISAIIASPAGRHSLYDFEACLQGPQLDTAEKQVQALLNSVRFRL